MEAAIAAARQAFVKGDWSTNQKLRLDCLRRLQNELRARGQDFSARVAAETGSAGIFDTELASGLYYGYVVIDVPQLVANLEGVAIQDWSKATAEQRALGATQHLEVGEVVEHPSAAALRGRDNAARCRAAQQPQDDVAGCGKCSFGHVGLPSSGHTLPCCCMLQEEGRCRGSVSGGEVTRTVLNSAVRRGVLAPLP